MLCISYVIFYLSELLLCIRACVHCYSEGTESPVTANHTAADEPTIQEPPIDVGGRFSLR